MARQLRNTALNDLAKVITEIYGPRCDRMEPTCSGCSAWNAFDQVERVTDTGLLDGLKTSQSEQ